MGAGFAQFAWIAMHLELAQIPKPLFNPESPPPTPVVAVEEPELHLHPRLQPAMARLLAEFSQHTGQVICTTQSEHFLLAILELILDGTISRDQVSVYYLDAPHGEVDQLDVDDKGRLKGGLKGFLEENEQRIERQIDLLRKSAGLDS
jgi:predicted ATPase